MKKIVKYFFFSFLTMIMMFNSVTAFAADNLAWPADNIQWTYDETTKTLTISGTGNTPYYYFEGAVPEDDENWTEPLRTPWDRCADQVEVIVIVEGITGIGIYAFIECIALKKVVFPMSVTHIAKAVFPQNIEFTIEGYTDSVAYNLLEEYPLAEFVEITKNSESSEEKDYDDDLESKVIDNGSWKYDLDTDTLIICDDSVMGDYYYEGAMDGDPLYTPWQEYHNQIKSVVIEDGVTMVGQYAFHRCEAIEKIVIPSSVIEIHKDILPDVVKSNEKFLVEGNAMTCAEIYAMENGYTFYPVNNQLLGDINQNNVYEAEDALSILKMCVKLETVYAYSADADQSGEVTAEDALFVLKKVVKL